MPGVVDAPAAGFPNTTAKQLQNIQFFSTCHGHVLLLFQCAYRARLAVTEFCSDIPRSSFVLPVLALQFDAANSIAARSLRVGQRLLSVNGVPVQGHDHATSLLKNAVGHLRLEILDEAPGQGLSYVIGRGQLRAFAQAAMIAGRGWIEFQVEDELAFFITYT